jgi:hypothetical protein
MESAGWKTAPLTKAEAFGVIVLGIPLYLKVMTETA